MEQYRRKRINLYKKIIIVSILFAVLIPIVICVILLWKVGRLEQRLDDFLAGHENAVLLEKPVEPGFIAHAYASEPENAGALEVPPEQEPETEPETVIEDTRKKVYLTFDDGPSDNTDAILDILKEYDAKATFFVIGKTDEDSRNSYQRIVDEGHTLGMHSYSHIYQDVYQSAEAFAEDTLKLQDYLYEVTGVRPVYYRFPGGSSNTISEVDMQEFIAWLHEHGIEYYDWNISSGDAAARTPDVETMVDNVMKDYPLFKSGMVLMHDASNKDRTVEALPLIIGAIRKADGVLLPLDNTVEPVQHIKPLENENP